MKFIKETYPKIYLYKRIVQAKIFIDKNFSEKIDLSQIAEEAYFSKFHFLRYFKKIYGKTPHQYLISVRIKEASQLFREGHHVSYVCFAVGFESISSFSGLFKRSTGCTPSEYLARQQQIKTQIIEAPLKFIPGCFAEKNGWKENRNFEEVS